jgi:archaetidylinositol phosphate synthase
MLGFLRKRTEELLASLTNVFVKANVNPNVISLVALLLAIISASFYYFKIIFLAVLFLLISGFLDMIDGMVARASKRESKLGNVLDSTLDRYADFLPILAIGLAGMANWIFVTIAIFGSLIPSYVRAKLEINIESKKIKAKSVIGERADRIILLILASLIYPLYKESFDIAFLLIFILGNFAVILRLWYNIESLK